MLLSCFSGTNLDCETGLILIFAGLIVWSLLIHVFHCAWLDVNKFNKKLKDTTGIEREKVVFDVEVADQTAVTEFFFNGELIKSGDRFEVKNLGGGKHQLIISDLQMTDDGEIKCRSGKLKSTCQLTVLKGEGKPIINFEGPVLTPSGKPLIMDIPYTGNQVDFNFEFSIREL